MKRREFITLLGGAAAAWPLAARTQQPMPVIGLLDHGSHEVATGNVAALRRGLKEGGYVEGQNVTIDLRYANGQFGLLPDLAAELVRRQATLIIASRSIGAALAARNATSSIPIVLVSGFDPVKYGLVASLNRPGGNVTGVNVVNAELAAKRLNLLRDLFPQVTTVAFLSGDARSLGFEEQAGDMLAAGRALGVQVIVLEIRSSRDIEERLANLAQHGTAALVVGAYPVLANNGNKILELAAHYKIPTIYPGRVFALGGGLMSYGANFADAFHLAGKYYVGKILTGTTPADLPVQRSTKFELVINLKTAKALGLNVPRILLAQADQVIQ